MPETLPQPATLLVKLHGKGSRHIELTLETLTIGRKADNTLVIEDPAVSGHHARIVKIQAVFFLEDLKSTNGTAINGRPITRHQLHDADVITIGQHRLVFQDNATTSTAPLAPFVDLDRTMVLRGTDPAPNEPPPTATVCVIAEQDRTEPVEDIKVTSISNSPAGRPCRPALGRRRRRGPRRRIGAAMLTAIRPMRMPAPVYRRASIAACRSTNRPAAPPAQLLRHLEKFAGQQQATFGVSPADQRLEIDRRIGRQIDDRLVVDGELRPAERPRSTLSPRRRSSWIRMAASIPASRHGRWPWAVERAVGMPNEVVAHSRASSGTGRCRCCRAHRSRGRHAQEAAGPPYSAPRIWPASRGCRKPSRMSANSSPPGGLTVLCRRCPARSRAATSDTPHRRRRAQAHRSALEGVEIEQHNAVSSPLRRPRPARLAQPLLEHAAVGQAGERVVIGQMPDARLGTLVLVMPILMCNGRPMIPASAWDFLAPEWPRPRARPPRCRRSPRSAALPFQHPLVRPRP